VIVVRSLLFLCLGLFILPVHADSGFNRCKKFASYPAAQLYTGTIYQPVTPKGVPAPLLKILPFIKDPRPDYAGYLHVIEAPLEQGTYRYWFWDLSSGRLISGPDSAQPALWRSDSRLFIVPSSTSRPLEFDHTGYRGAPQKDSAAYYLWDEDQHHPQQTKMILLDCGN
jgi:hypothetical protein